MVVVMVVGLQLQMSLVGALFFDVVCGYALLAAAATHTCLFFCSDPFSTHTDTHIHTHTYTHLSTDHAAFTSEKIISVVTHSILLHDAHIHRWSDITCTIKTRPLRKGSFAPPGTVSPPTPGPRSRDRTCPDSRLPRNPQQPTAPPSEPNHVHIIEPVPLRPSCADFGVESGFGVWGQDPNTCCRSKATEA